MCPVRKVCTGAGPTGVWSDRVTRTLIDHCSEGMLVSDLRGTILDVNEPFTRITGYSREELIGNNPRMMKSDRHDMAFYGQMWGTLLRDGVWSGEIWDRRRDGELLPKWMTLAVVRDEAGRPVNYVSIFSDISAVKESEGRLERLAHFDRLTGLPNGSLILDRLDTALERAKGRGRVVVVLVLDLDRFRPVNDALGYRQGDDLLTQVAMRLVRAAGEGASVARPGGDEFTVVAEASGRDGAEQLAADVLGVFDEPFAVDGRELFITASVGVAIAPEDGADVEAMTQCADSAMYCAKRAGGNRAAFSTSGIQDEFVSRFEMENDLRRALLDEEFVLHYQPQIELATGRVHGVESLIRWDRPHQGMVPPGRFIGIAQDAGLIVPMSAWATRAACAAMCEVPATPGLPLEVAVNYTASDFLEPGFVDGILQALEDHCLDPARFEVEITEGTLLADSAAAAAKLDALRETGVRVALDDFGTGYSSLNYVRQFHVDRLKIDKSFVDGLPADPDSRAIVDATLSMSQALGIETVAEGVEDAEQAAYLREKGCTYIQGYYFSKPLPLPDLVDFVENGLVSVP